MRALAYLWALPNTLLSVPFVLAALLSGGGVRLVEGVLEVHGRALAWLFRRAVPLAGGVQAMTLGHVVLGRDAAALDRCRAHEQAHVRHYETWGPFFLPAYFAAGLLAFLRGGNPYWDNPFERDARRAERG